MKLLLTEHGTAELLDNDDDQLWSSDNDPDFEEEFGDDFIADDDAEDVLDYLVENEYLPEEELDNVIIEVHHLDDDQDDDNDTPDLPTILGGH